MKKILLLSLLVTISTISFLSCKKKSKEDPGPTESDVCIKRTIEDSSSSMTNGATELYKYRGGKLVYYNSNIHRSGYISSREQVEYSYNSDGLLSTMLIYSNNGQTKDYTNYTYSNGKIAGYTTTVTGLGASNDGYPMGKYYYDSNGRIKAFVESYNSTQKDSTLVTINEEGKVTYKKIYHYGVLYEEHSEITFDANGNQLTIRYKRYDSGGNVTQDSKHTSTPGNTKNPIFADTDKNIVYGYNPIHNYGFYIGGSGESYNMLTSTTDSKSRTTLTFDDQNRVVRSRSESYNFATSEWEFNYDYTYEYTCD